MRCSTRRTFIGSLVVAVLLAPVAGVGHAAQDQRPQAASLRDVEVYRAGADGYHTFRIPAIVRAPSGALLAFAEGRRAGRGDAGDIDLVLRRSDDGGRTWSALTVVGDNGPNTFGNPCVVVDRRTGVIILLTTHNRGTDREAAIIDGTASASRTVWQLTSRDDGRTWSAPVEITAQVKRDGWTWYATGPGIGVQLSSGRLVMPANHAIAGSQEHRSHLLLSDDGGLTWRIGGISVAGTNESQVAVVDDGHLLVNMRNHPPRDENVRMVAISRDGGETLGPPQPDHALPEPPAQASLLRLPADGSRAAPLLVFANPAGPGRTRMALRVSFDDGQSWPVTRLLFDGPAAYSSLVALDAGEVGVLYERGEASPYEAIVFTRATVAAR